MFNHSDGSWWMIPDKAWDQLLVRDDLFYSVSCDFLDAHDDRDEHEHDDRGDILT